MLDTRVALGEDFQKFVLFDKNIALDPDRSALITSALNLGNCWVSGQSGSVDAYAILSPRSFFHYDFLALLFVKPNARRLGIACALLDVVEAASETEKLFTSTNESNLAMWSLLRKRGYIFAGEIDQLDPGDPELVFVKFVNPSDSCPNSDTI